MEGQTAPKHVGLILDGNRRWAKSHGLPTLEGHRRGAETFREVALHAFERGIHYVSAYTFSSENWQRTDEEVGYLMKLLVKAVEKHLEVFNKADIKIVLLGRRDGLSASVLKAMTEAEQKTANNTKGTLALCFNYGGIEELVDAAKQIVASRVPAESITRESIFQNVYSPEIPPLDLIIRTSGERRVSGFMLARSEYAELYFTDTLWPDFNAAAFDKALTEYSQRIRRYGK